MAGIHYPSPHMFWNYCICTLRSMCNVCVCVYRGIIYPTYECVTAPVHTINDSYSWFIDIRIFKTQHVNNQKRQLIPIERFLIQFSEMKRNRNHLHSARTRRRRRQRLILSVHDWLQTSHTFIVCKRIARNRMANGQCLAMKNISTICVCVCVCWCEARLETSVQP